MDLQKNKLTAYTLYKHRKHIRNGDVAGDSLQAQWDAAKQTIIRKIRKFLSRVTCSSVSSIVV